MPNRLILLICLQAAGACSILDEECESEGSIGTELLQRQAQGHRVAKKGRELQLPIYWMHIPKCNSGFGKSIVAFLPQTCKNMPEGARTFTISTDLPRWCAMLEQKTCEDYCPGDFPDLRSLGFNFGDHSSIGAIYSEHVQGRGMVVLRQPEQRLLSGYADVHHSWPWAYFRRGPKDEVEYASIVGGCMTKMMTRNATSQHRGTSNGNLAQNVSSCGDPAPVTEEELTRAVSHLRGFAFVGILENYSLSICLFHTMFGGACHSEELTHSHHTENGDDSSGNSSSGYDVSVLKGWTDVNDRALYAEGQRIFQENLKLYGVTDASCSTTCYAEASASL